MRTSQFILRAPDADIAPHPDAQLLLVFGSGALLSDPRCYARLRAAAPDALLLGCSTAGEIAGTSVHDDTLVVTAIRFTHTALALHQETIEGLDDSWRAGLRLAEKLRAPTLKHVFVLSEGLHVNGSELVAGLYEGLRGSASITGGLAGDGSRFQQTWVLANQPAQQKIVAAVGLYGERLKVGFGSLGGWSTFGPERLVTRASGNLLYQLDGESALALYKRYLGEHAASLPASGLLFPLRIKLADEDPGIVRTILGIDEERN